jgi:hypothetical protein
MMVSDRTTGNPLSAGSLALFMATALPRGEDRKLKNGTEAVALAVHAGMLAVGFRLVGVGEDEKTGEYMKDADLHIYTPCYTLTRLILLLRHS